MGAYVSLVLLSLSVFPVPDNKENYRYVKYICVCVYIYRMQIMFPKSPNI